MKLKFNGYLCLVILFLATACAKNEERNNGTAEMLREFYIYAKSTNQNFQVNSQADSSRIVLQIYGNNEVRYDAFIKSANVNNDTITAVEIRLGNPNTNNGALIATLPGRLRVGYAVGVLPGVRQSLIDTLMNDNIEKYINVTTVNEPLGYVRGQFNNRIVFSQSVILNGTNAGTTTNTTGTAFIRVTEDSTLYSSFEINNNDPADPVQTATIHAGTVNQPGAAVVVIANNASDFTTARVTNLTGAQMTQFLNNPLIVNVTSAAFPNGKIRGGLR